MSSGGEHHSLGNSAGTSTDGWVGQRVVVRRLLRGETGPSGGPAMTDVLGTCLRADDVEVVVQPESGPAVVIALADVVTGKPVPPRASVRARVPARTAQLHGGALFADLVTEPLGSWVVRRAASFSARRANSVLAFGPSGLAPGDDVEQVVAAYDRPVVAVLTGSPEARRFEDLGWVPESNDGDTVFQVAGVAQVARAVRDVGTSAVALDGDDAHVVARIGDAASGASGLRDDWVGFRAIEVSPDHRRRGLGLTIMAALLGWGAERGATTAYLQVLDGNEPALALYARLGFREHHRYRYLAPGRTPSPGGS